MKVEIDFLVNLWIRKEIWITCNLKSKKVRCDTVVGDTYFVWLMIAGGPAAAASGGYGPTAGTGGAAGGGPGGSWNSWNMPQNGPPPGTQPPPQPPQPNSSQPNSNSNPSGPQGESSSSVKQTLLFPPLASDGSILT